LHYAKIGKLKNKKGERNYEDSALVKVEEREMGSYINITLYPIDGFKVLCFGEYNPTPVSDTIYCRVGSD